MLGTDVRPELFTEERSGEVVAASFAAAPDPRLRQILETLVRYLHAFAKDVGLSQSELDAAIEFLTRTGQTCDATRQEFVLLSDVLGLSMLVDAIANRGPGTATESTVLGPFHMTASPPRSLGDCIADVGGGEPTLVTGCVRGSDGAPLAGAVLDVWQGDAEGFYDVQRPGVVPAGNLRGLFRCDAEGRFRFRTVLPVPYAIPADGPVGELLTATGRQPWRPAHLHVIATAAGHAPLTTHLFVAGSPYLHSDAVFGVKESLIVEFCSIDDADEAARLGMPAPCRHATVDLRLRGI
jgi:catechol 1,2-dioxygenase